MVLAAIVGLAIVDNLRPWKRLQLEFLELERRQLESRLEVVRAGADETVADLEARLDVETTRLVDRQDEVAQLEEDLRRFRGKSRAAELRHQQLSRTNDPDLVDDLQQTRIEIESLAEMIADRENKLAAVRSDHDRAREELAQARAPIEMLERRLEEHPGPPILPFGLWSSGVAIRQVTTEAAVDRCVTCHLAAPRDDVVDDDWPAPLRQHSAHELFLGAESPHPYSQFGCTVCHGGDGRATDFSRAGHVPRTAEQASSWESTWGWRPVSHSMGHRAMLPLDLTAASCASCHGHEAPRSGAATAPQLRMLDRGQRLITSLGCMGCHASDPRALTERPRVGPSLVGIAGKTTPAWVQRWLKEPRAFRGSTGMPHVFDTGEAATPEQAAEIRAIVDYLWHVSRPPQYGSSPDGEAEAGKMLFETVGCSGCHSLDLEADGAEGLGEGHGPHLAGTGSKVDAGWLFAWLQDPQAYRRDTPMPNLRLDDGEAADLVAYLMTRRDPAWEGLALAAVDSASRDPLILSSLAESQTLEESAARFDRMNDRDKNLYLGEQAITRYGCQGCHEIPGFEQRPVVASPLSEVSQRLRDGVSSAIGEPWLESSHRPAYRLSDEERRAVTVALLALAADTMSPVLRPSPALTEGRRVVELYGCRGCHQIEGRGGSTAPDLAFTGARLKASWLNEYLADPSQELRPWLKVRMPTFGLTEAENNALVHYFAALDDRPLFADEPRSEDVRTDVAVGRVVFTMLHCGDCHQPESEESPSPQLAPSYRLASERLRPDWVTSLILNPEHWLPGTVMPANFRPDGGDQESSDFLIGSINTPIFAAERNRLLRLLGSEERLHEVLSDPERVVAALRHYLWTLGK